MEQELLILPEHLSSPPVFSGARVTRSVVLYVSYEDHRLSFCIFSFGHCVVWSSSIYGFWLPLWYLQALRVYLSCIYSICIDWLKFAMHCHWAKYSFFSYLVILGKLVCVYFMWLMGWIVLHIVGFRQATDDNYKQDITHPELLQDFFYLPGSRHSPFTKHWFASPHPYTNHSFISPPKGEWCIWFVLHNYHMNCSMARRK